MQAHNPQIFDCSWETGLAILNLYLAMSALTLHLGLDRPSSAPNPANKKKKVLIWGASSSFGLSATRVAVDAGYSVVGAASAHNADLVRSAGVGEFADRKSASVVHDLVAMGPFFAVLAANDSAQDQNLLGAVLKAQGGGTILSTMGLRGGVVLPEGVTVTFAQFLDDYLVPENADFIEWVWWNYMENIARAGTVVTTKTQFAGGLSNVQDAWDLLKSGSLSGTRLIIQPDLE